MKTFKHIQSRLREFSAANAGHPPADLTWQLICYLPKLPLRHNQQQLIEQAEKIPLIVTDPYFTQTEVPFTAYRWGKGPVHVIITHGWASKAADFIELITTLRDDGRFTVTSFDAPLVHTQEAGEASYMLLFINAVKAIVNRFGPPRVLVGHSLGAMANAVVTSESLPEPFLLVSIAPIVRLKENFEDSMNGVGMSRESQEYYFKLFEERFREHADYFRLGNMYRPQGNVTHWLAYDSADQVSHFPFLEEFLVQHPEISATDYPGVGHERIFRAPQVIADIMRHVDSYLAAK